MNEEEYRLPRYKEIPDVGLLLDQVARLVNNYLEPYQDIRLTNSMISNYVKHDIIARPVKKLYYREQIASLVFIAVAKTVLSLDDIVTLLRIQRQNHTPDTAYNVFCESFENELHENHETRIQGIAADMKEEHNAAKNKTSFLDNAAALVAKSQIKIVGTDDTADGIENANSNVNANANVSTVNANANANVSTDIGTDSMIATAGSKETSYADDSYLLHSLIKAVADCIRLKQMLAARR